MSRFLVQDRVGRTLKRRCSVISSLQPKTFEFPDGSTKAFGRPRFTIPEVLFNPLAFLPPEFINSTPPTNPASTIQTPPLSQATPLSRSVLTAVERSDADLQSTLLSNVVVTGGSSLMTGLVERLDFELRAAAPGVKVKVAAPGNVVERRFGAWLGGSILASLGTFHQLWISKEEYQEQGRSIIHRRCK